MARGEENLMQWLRDTRGSDMATAELDAESVVSVEEDRTCGDCEAKSVYFSLLRNPADEGARASSRVFLSRQLAASRHDEADLPGDPAEINEWIMANTAKVGAQYRHYLNSRKMGGPRRYFTSKAHALYFLKAIAPTKLVDGAWLYGLLDHWRDARFGALIRIYLEELGEGVADRNHVLIYKQLLAAHGCEQWQQLDDTYFVQGSIQLALASHTAHFMPEVIGFNLGYEQLPLHLLISAYELNELGIDPYYFTLHITVDNSASGHAIKAAEALFDAMPAVGDQGAFYQRVVNGYKLGSRGASSTSVIAEFDARQELLSILGAKCGVGSHMHSDYSRVAGKSVNEWLADPALLPAFVDTLEQIGWIRRHQDPDQSRFWRLIHGDRAAMFGVFTAYERQVIHDWIAGESLADSAVRRRPPDRVAPASRASGYSDMSQRPDDFDNELRLLDTRLRAAPDKDAKMTMLTKLMSPPLHHTVAGLMATRTFTRLFAGS